jgi:hypothetical protein
VAAFSDSPRFSYGGSPLAARLIDKKKLESRPKSEMLPFQDIIYQELERSKTTLKQDKVYTILSRCMLERQGEGEILYLVRPSL